MRFRMWMAFMMAIGQGGCAHSPPPPENTDSMAYRLKDAPEWVKGTCRSYFKAGTSVLCGVGSVTGSRNPSMARSGATARARSELASSLKTAVVGLLEDYQSNTMAQGGSGTAGWDEQKIAEASRQISEATLSGTQVNTTWISPGDDYYVLVSMDAESFKKYLEQMRTLDEATRRHISSNAEEMFQKLDLYTTK